MYRILIWGLGLRYSQYINAIKYQECLGNIKIIGVTGKDKLYTCLDGYRFIPIDKIKFENIDYIVVTSEEYYMDICEEAVKIEFQQDRIIQGKVFCLPYFDFNKYVDLLHSKISIIANNCWGGTAYHALGMKFCSPFINMFLDDTYYLRLLCKLRHYLNMDLQFERMGYNEILKRNYPVCRLDDIELHFNHYVSMEEAERKWVERLKRINWGNLFVMMFTEDKQTVEIFEHLPYEKKVCFVPFECPLKSAFNLQVASHKEMYHTPFWEIVNITASGQLHDYDLIELLRTGIVNHDRYYTS